MYTRLIRQGRSREDFAVTHVDFTEVSPDEGRLLIAALLEYRKNLQQTLVSVKEKRQSGRGAWAPDNPQGLVSGGFEDEAFCYGELQSISRMLYEMGYDFEAPMDTKAFNKFTDGIMESVE
jgi:hypothetical protein